ncbi:MAG TPA: hypothetical protein PLY81_00585 [Chitinophagaceae bacterium]|nr:hypothetical protein [Chitinophagaceae bacterium]MCC6635599.1 hypothetical protein [Chitinophagaceae bacterium]HNE92956.1 hypothetical protein [Chitinophagaceae bacterium]HNF28755.1 hypothetical protein [Chitinophagaceae bacterium]HNM34117.1 hypothetical protein [Chitinophagaceae bacterium]
MDISYSHLIPTNFSDNAKVWIYQSSRKFTINEALQIEAILDDFIAQWQSHGIPVKGFATLFFGQFLVFMADDNVDVSGCSTSSSVDVVKQVEKIFNVEMFNRQNLAFVVKDEVQLLPLAQLNYALSNSFITANTLYFNNTVTNKNTLLSNWIIPVNKSWLKTKLSNLSA